MANRPGPDDEMQRLAPRWGQSNLHRLMPDGDRRVRAVIDLWGLKWSEVQ